MKQIFIGLGPSPFACSPVVEDGNARFDTGLALAYNQFTILPSLTLRTPTQQVFKSLHIAVCSHAWFSQKRCEGCQYTEYRLAETYLLVLVSGHSIKTYHTTCAQK